MRKAEEIYQQKVSEAREIETELEQIRAELMQHTAAVERLAEIEKQQAANIERLAERTDGLRREGKRAGEVFAEHTAEQRKLEKELIKARAKSAELRDEKQKLTEATGESRLNLQVSEKSLAKSFCTVGA